MPAETEYASLLADMETKRSALDAAIASLKAAIASGALGKTSDISVEQLSFGTTAASSRSADIPSGAFLGKSMPDAIKAYLGLIRRKQTTREIADALIAGGFRSLRARNHLGAGRIPFMDAGRRAHLCGRVTLIAHCYRDYRPMPTGMNS